jgi:hypothetical protein
MEASELNEVFKTGLSDGYADKVIDAFPSQSRKVNASKA